jgi:hypothetical protein
MRRVFDLPGVLLTTAMLGYIASSFSSGAAVARLRYSKALAPASAVASSTCRESPP